MMERKVKSGLLSYLLLLTGLFLLLEISFVSHCGNVYLGEFSYVTKHLQIPRTILPGIVYFILAQLLVHFVFTVLIWVEARLIGIAVSLTWRETQALGFRLWGIGLVTSLLLNQYYFYQSTFAMLTRHLIPNVLVGWLAAAFVMVMISATIIALVGLFRLAFRRWLLALVALFALSGLAFAAYSQNKITPPQDAATRDRPNIIIIGVDALRPDFLGYFGYIKRTPHFDEFLNHAVVFTNAMTPLARTFPAWVSLLTGEYPKVSGVRFNLMDQSKIDLAQTLPAILRQHGYETIYAMDETRFSNIDQNFGYDQLVTPPIGVNDFLLGSINDFPFSNLIVNSWIGAKLFPYSYGNRPVYVTYNPNSFLKRLQTVLQAKRTKPVFLSVHFCLPHYPYFWGEYHPHSSRALRHYQAAVKRADEQVGDFLKMLQDNHFLEHSIVILMSDHGEAIELHGDRVTQASLYVPGKQKQWPRFYPPSMDDEAVDQSAGHGTDVLGLSQYHSVLAFRTYGIDPVNNANIPGIVSLMDIKPTLLTWLQIPFEQKSGRSLLPFVLGKQSNAQSAQDFFIESDFSPAAVRSVHPETSKVLFEGIDYYQINPKTTRVTVRKSMADLILSSKQYADLYNNWVLALYPQDKNHMMPILVNLETGQWTNDLSTAFAQHSPAGHMLAALKSFYQSDITQII